MEVINMKLTVYLAGQIHDNWREELKEKVAAKGLDIDFVAPQTDHNAWDDSGEKILGEQPNHHYRDDAASDINNFRTQILMNKADLVIALFGDQYRQWNTAMDATTAINHNKPLIIVRPTELIHSLKELSNKANVTVETLDQAVEVLDYVFK